jgi:uncharacterized integral membrane protein (TIGR00698 family)
MEAGSPRPSGLRCRLETAGEQAPGILLSAAVALAAYLLAPLIARVLPIPAMVLALIIGMMLNRLAQKPAMQPGLAFCVKTLLRWAVALLGLRVGLADIAALGAGTALLVIAAMVSTIVSGFLLARLNGQPAGYGALAGAATAVCGASAALATSTVVPSYPGKEADIVFVVMAANALATAGMVLMPPLCLLLGFDPHVTGVVLGGTIHDVAQVVGAGYAVSEPVGNTAVIVKLFRVFLLLPVVLGIGWYLSSARRSSGAAKVPLPVFAFVFLVLCLVNSAIPLVPGLLPLYGPVRGWLIEFSTWGLLIALAALGLGTSLSALAKLGWRRVSTMLATTLVISILVIAGCWQLRIHQF